jgi:hypothetical protein
VNSPGLFFFEGKNMPLPPTYYDFVKRNHPYIVELTDLDASDLLSAEPKATTIHSVDDYESRFFDCIEIAEKEILINASKQTGMSIDQLRPYLRGAHGGIGSIPAQFYNTINYEYHCLVNFALSGKKTFYFSDNLSDHLVNTEINLKAKFINLPFESCMFVFTSKNAINAMHNFRGNAGRWDINTLGLDYAAPISAFITMFPGSPELPGRKLMICACHARPPKKSYLMLKRELYLDEAWTLEEALHTDWENLTPNDLGIGISADRDKDVIEPLGDEKFYTDGLVFYRMILNSILYLSSDQAEQASKESPRAEVEAKAQSAPSMAKRRKILQAGGKYSELDYAEVGQSVGPIVIHKAETNANTSLGVGKKPMVRFMVRGHWRHQPCGIERQERKIIWIRPFFKGPDLAAIVNKPYIVK